MTTQANPAPPDEENKPTPPPTPPKVTSGYVQIVDENGKPVVSESTTTWYSSDCHELMNVKTQLGITSRRLGKARFTIKQLKEDNRKKRERIKELELQVSNSNTTPISHKTLK